MTSCLCGLYLWLIAIMNQHTFHWEVQYHPVAVDWFWVSRPRYPIAQFLLEEGFGAVISQGETQIFRQLLQQGNDALDGSWRYFGGAQNMVINNHGFDNHLRKPTTLHVNYMEEKTQ